MAAFKRTEIFNPPRAVLRSTEDTLYWKNFEFPISVKEYGPIDFVDFARHQLHQFAVTSSCKVQIFNSQSSEVVKVISRFKNSAFGGRFRHDGQLLTAGSEEGNVALFDVQSKGQLRLFKGHKGSVHRCDFLQSGTQIVSFSDDKTVAIWDIPSESKVAILEGHKDYVRAGAVSRGNQNIIVSGSYDHYVKLFDMRTAECIKTFDHESQVESVLVFPSGNVAISAGGTYVKVWDLVAGRLLAQVSQHHKSVTCLSFASNYSRLLSASLDKQVKAYDTSSYQVVHTIEFPAPLLSIAISPDDRVVVGGMTDGLISIRHRKAPEQSKDKGLPKRSHYRYQMFQDEYRPAEGDVLIKDESPSNITTTDKYLKSFQSSKALDSVMREYLYKKKPNIAISIIKELIRRESLKSALAGRDAQSLAPIMKFVIRHIGDPKYSRTLLDVAIILIDMYGPQLGDDGDLKKQFERLHEAVNKELQIIHEMLDLCGVLKTVLNVTSNHTLLDSIVPLNNVNKVI